jgi:hypothetical protein
VDQFDLEHKVGLFVQILTRLLNCSSRENMQNSKPSSPFD